MEFSINRSNDKQEAQKIVITIGGNEYRLSQSGDELVINKAGLTGDGRININPAASNEIRVT